MYDCTLQTQIGTFMYKHQTNELLSNYSTYLTKHIIYIQTHNYITSNTSDYMFIVNIKDFFSLNQRAIGNCGSVFRNSLKNIQKYRTQIHTHTHTHPKHTPLQANTQTQTKKQKKKKMLAPTANFNIHTCNGFGEMRE